MTTTQEWAARIAIAKHRFGTLFTAYDMEDAIEASKREAIAACIERVHRDFDTEDDEFAKAVVRELRTLL